MLKNKKMLRFFGLLAGLAALVIVWLVVIQPLTRNDQDDNIAYGEDYQGEDTQGGGLDGAVIDGDDDRPPVGPGASENNDTTTTDESDNDVAQAPTTQAPDTPSELTVTGPVGVSVVSILGLTVATYLFFFNRQLKKATKRVKSLTYHQR